jgi:hypothetical protein
MSLYIPTPLCILAEKYLVDKCPHINHTYTPTYNSILDPLRNTTTLFLEIGIGNAPLMAPIVGIEYKPGASLRMWRDYFPNATIVGCDIMESVLFHDEERIKTFYADQSNPESLLSLVKHTIQPPNTYIDIILDDGSHFVEHQIVSFKTLWEFVRPNGGLYIIEDILTSSVEILKNLPLYLNFTDAEVTRIYNDGRDAHGFIVFRKK